MTATQQELDLGHLTPVYENTDVWWKSNAEQAIAAAAASGLPFTAYTLTQMGVPDPDQPNRWGAIFRAAHQRREIEPIGYDASARPSRSGGACRVWRGVAHD